MGDSVFRFDRIPRELSHAIAWLRRERGIDDENWRARAHLDHSAAWASVLSVVHLVIATFWLVFWLVDLLSETVSLSGYRGLALLIVMLHAAAFVFRLSVFNRLALESLHVRMLVLITVLVAELAVWLLPGSGWGVLIELSAYFWGGIGLSRLLVVVRNQVVSRLDARPWQRPLRASLGRLFSWSAIPLIALEAMGWATLFGIFVLISRWSRTRSEEGLAFECERDGCGVRLHDPPLRCAFCFTDEPTNSEPKTLRTWPGAQRPLFSVCPGCGHWHPVWRPLHRALGNQEVLLSPEGCVWNCAGERTDRRRHLHVALLSFEHAKIPGIVRQLMEWSQSPQHLSDVQPALQRLEEQSSEAFVPDAGATISWTANLPTAPESQGVLQLSMLDPVRQRHWLGRFDVVIMLLPDQHRGSCFAFGLQQIEYPRVAVERTVPTRGAAFSRIDRILGRYQDSIGHYRGKNQVTLVWAVDQPAISGKPDDWGELSDQAGLVGALAQVV